MDRNMRITDLPFLMKKMFIETEAICEKHHVKLVKRNGSSNVFCHLCREEKIINQDRMLSERLTNRHYNDSAYWLESHSIFTDETLKTSMFNNFVTYTQELTMNKKKASEIANKYIENATFNTIFLGSPGAGKSHLAMSILKYVNKASSPPKKCIFVAVDQMFRVIKDSFNNPEAAYTAKSIVDMIIEADLVVLDDIGSETGGIKDGKPASSYTVNTFYSIMNGRANKPTILTTNHNTKSIYEIYDAKLTSRFLRDTKTNRIIFEETRDWRIQN